MNSHFQQSKGIGGRVSPKKGIGGQAQNKSNQNQCFFVVASKETDLINQLHLIRKYRDNILCKTTLGIKVIEYYYKKCNYSYLLEKYPCLKLPAQLLVRMVIVYVRSLPI